MLANGERLNESASTLYRRDTQRMKTTKRVYSVAKGDDRGNSAQVGAFTEQRENIG